MPARVAAAMAALPRLAAVCVALGSDAETFAAASAALRAVHAAPPRSALAGVRVVAYVSRAWAPLVSSLGGVPVTGELAAPALAAALLAAPQGKPPALLRGAPPGAPAALAAAVSEQLVEGPALWALMGVRSRRGAGGAAGAEGGPPDAAGAEALALAAAKADAAREVAAREAAAREAAAREAAAREAEAAVAARVAAGAVGVPVGDAAPPARGAGAGGSPVARGTSRGPGFLSAMMASLGAHVELDDGEDEDAGAARVGTCTTPGASALAAAARGADADGHGAAADALGRAYGGASEAMDSAAPESGGGGGARARGGTGGAGGGGGGAGGRSAAAAHIAAHGGGMAEIVTFDMSERAGAGADGF